jgi:hypothetical protein
MRSRAYSSCRNIHRIECKQKTESMLKNKKFVHWIKSHTSERNENKRNKSCKVTEHEHYSERVSKINNKQH